MPKRKKQARRLNWNKLWEENPTRVILAACATCVAATAALGLFYVERIVKPPVERSRTDAVLEKERVSKKLSGAERKLGHTQSKLDRTESELQAMRFDQQKIALELGQLKIDAADCDEQLQLANATLESELPRLQSELESIAKENTALSAAVSAALSRQERLAQLEGQLATVSAELDALRSDRDTRRAGLERARRQCASSRGVGSLISCRSVPMLETAVASLDSQIERLANREARLMRQIDQAQ